MPVRLRRYDPADWPNPVCHAGCALWPAVDDWDEHNPGDDASPLELIDVRRLLRLGVRGLRSGAPYRTSSGVWERSQSGRARRARTQRA
jgi:hypothetical protein